MTVTWSTLDHVDASVVEVAACPSGFFGDDCVELVQQYSLQWTVNGTVKPFVDGGSNHRTQYIHRVYLSGLKPLTNYSKLPSQIAKCTIQKLDFDFIATSPETIK